MSSSVAVVDLVNPAPAGSPWPFPDATERKRHHTEQATLAEKEKQWFAVAFHLGRLLLDDPDNADLKARYAAALDQLERVRALRRGAGFQKLAREIPARKPDPRGCRLGRGGC
jgi:hypothetical protein